MSTKFLPMAAMAMTFAVSAALAPAAMAADHTIGSGSVSVSGDFTYDHSGPPFETVIGTFTFGAVNTLPTDNGTYDWILGANVSTTDDGTVFDGSFPIGSFSITSLSQFAMNLVDPAFLGNLLGGQPAEFSEVVDGFTYGATVTATENDDGTGGTFSITSDQNFGGSGNPGDLVLPPAEHFDATLTLTAVPEPASMALLGAGLAGLGVIRRRRNKQ